MNWQTYKIELITPCFCAGANQSQAEIRVPSIRGQLRWWFRALGGLRALGNTSLPRQEGFIFGSAAGERGNASILQLRLEGQSLKSNVARDAEQMNAKPGSELGYFLFPLRKNPRGVFDWNNLPTFNLNVGWRKPVTNELTKNMQALISIFAYLGCIGARGRRGFGAMRLLNPQMNLQEALACFGRSDSIHVKQLSTPPNDGVTSLKQLSRWLSGWRSHGRSCDHERNQPPLPPHNPGFKYAKADHDIGLANDRTQKVAFRPALGLPIVQFYSSKKPPIKVNWEESQRIGEGRFASPVILRPYRDTQGNWQSLVIFVDSHKWPDGKPVFIGRAGSTVNVSLELYNQMKRDISLREFLI